MSDGRLLLVDKPSGPTSHDIVQRVRRSTGTRVGHTGTLDPFATGLLVLLLGPATRISQYMVGLEKSYRATTRLGVRTTTDDPEGDVIETSDAWQEIDRNALESALSGLTGEILQRPPPFSAKKVGGVAAHRRVRRGEDLVLDPVAVTVHELSVIAFDGAEVELEVRCSSGTYVRALARDLGEALGCGAHLTALRRTRVGDLEVGAAAPAAALDDPGLVARYGRSPLEGLGHLASVDVDASQIGELRHGRFVTAPVGAPEGQPLALTHASRLVAVGERVGAEIRPRKVFVS